MPVSIAPSAEALQFITSTINAGTAYTLPSAAQYTYLDEEDLTATAQFAVWVIHKDEETLQEVLDAEDWTSHDILVLCRQQLADSNPSTVDGLALIVRKIFQQLNENRISSSTRVTTWDCDQVKANPDKALIRKLGLFEMRIELRVEVEPSTL